MQILFVCKSLEQNRWKEVLLSPAPLPGVWHILLSLGAGDYLSGRKIVNDTPTFLSWKLQLSLGIQERVLNMFLGSVCFCELLTVMMLFNNGLYILHSTLKGLHRDEGKVSHKNV